MQLDLVSGRLDLDRGQLHRPEGGVERLTDTERRLLRYLAERPGQAISRDDLQQAVWGYRAGILSRTVFTTVGRVRAKIEPDPSRPRHLITAAGGGYALALGEGKVGPPRRGALPAAATPFVGRRQALAEVTALLEGARLVSILGPGGVGKTRLAMEIVQRRSDPAIFVALESAVEVGQTPAAVAAALGERLAGRDEWGELADLIGEGSLLCVLDNVEQLGGLAERLGPWLRACPGLVLLVTSRLRLGLRAERAHALSPMGLPSSGETLEESEAGALLLEHARRARPGWEVSAAERRALAELCVRAGGSPLAIELAAAWLRLIEPEELLREFESGEVLRAIDIDVPEKHRSIEATLGASWRLLAPPAVGVLEGLSVLHNPFDRATAGAVAGADLMTLGQLVDASMIHRIGARFDLHPLVRQDARRRLAQDAPRLDHVAGRHARFFLERMTLAIGDMENLRVESGACIAALAREHDDLLAAWFNRARAGDMEALASAAPALYRYLDSRNRLPELIDAFRAAGEGLRGAAGSLAEEIRAALTVLSSGAGDVPPEPAGAGPSRFDQVPGALRPTALIHAAIRALHAAGPEASIPLTEEAEALARAGGFPFLPGFALAVRGSARLRLGELDAARADLEAAMQSSSEGRAFARPSVHLGEVELAAGNLSLARRYLEDALAACRAADDRSFSALALCRLGQALERLGEDGTAVRIEAIEEGVSSRLPRVWWASALMDLGASWASSGDEQTARDGVVLLAAAASGPTMEPPAATQRALDEARTRVSRGAWYDACREGRSADDGALLALVRRERDGQKSTASPSSTRVAPGC